jgi:hypothetical protein
MQQRELAATLLRLKFLNDGVPTASVSTGESHVIMSQTEVGRRARSKVRARLLVVIL